MTDHRQNARLRSFYILVVTQALSLIGSRITSVALGIHVFVVTGQAAPLLLISFFNELPAMLFNSLAGVWVDRWDRRTVMILADTGQAVGSLLLMFSFLSGAFQLWHLYAVAFMQGVFVMFQEPAKSAVVTVLIPDQERDRANAILGMSHPLAGVLAPALAGVLYGVVGLAGVIFIDMATFLIAVTAVSLMHMPRPTAHEDAHAVTGHFWHELAEGFRFLLAHPALLTLILYFAALNFLLNGPLGLLIPYLVTITGSESLTGLVLSVESIGGFIGAGLLAAAGTRIRSRIRVLIPVLFTVGLLIVCLGATRSPLVIAISIALIVAGLQVWVLQTSLLQVKTPPELQGRVFSISNQFGYLGAVSSFLFIGMLVDRVIEPAVGTAQWAAMVPLVGDQPGAGMALVIIVSGLIITLLTLTILAVPSIRNLESHLPDYEGAAE